MIQALIILGAVLFVAVVLLREEGKIIEKIAPLMGATVVIGVLTFGVTFVVLVVLGQTVFNERIESRQSIASLSLGQNVSGSFFLGIGSVSDRERYYYFSKYKDGGQRLGWCLATDAYIYEGNQEEPHVVHYWDAPRLPRWLSLSNFGPERWLGSHIYVPEGTVVQQYVVDARDIN